MARYAVMRERYTRYGEGGMRVSKFTANSDLEALIKVDDHCGYGWCDDKGNELGDEGFKMPSFEDVLDHLTINNGDGADYIFKIENLDTGKTLFGSGETFFEEDVNW